MRIGEREKAGRGGIEEGSKELLWLEGEWFDLGGDEGGIDQYNFLLAIPNTRSIHEVQLQGYQDMPGDNGGGYRVLENQWTRTWGHGAVPV